MIIMNHIIEAEEGVIYTIEFDKDLPNATEEHAKDNRKLLSGINANVIVEMESVDAGKPTLTCLKSGCPVS